MTPASLRFLKAMCVAAAGSMVLAACGNNPTTSTNLAADQTLKFPILGDFGTLDPAQDGLTYTFKLRQDVTFSNGDKVTSADVLYSWNRAAAEQGAYATNLAAIDGYAKVSANTVNGGAALEALLEKKDPSVILSGLSAPDPSTVAVKLSGPAGWFLSAIALEATTAMIVDQKVVKTDFDNWWTKPETAIGTGAYKISSYVPKTSIDFAAVDNWWGSPKPTLKKVHIDILGNAHSAINAYEQGSYDLYGYGGYSNAPVDDILRIQGTANEKSQLLLHPKVRTTWVAFNLVHDAKRPAAGPFLCPPQTKAMEDTCSTPAGAAAKNLRLAFALAVDKTKLATVVCHDIVCAPATGGLITKGLIGYAGDNTDPLAKFDAAQAMSLLKQGDPDGSKTKGLTYTYDPNNPLNASVAQFLQDQWQTNLGIHVDLQPVDHSAFIHGYLAGKYVLNRQGWQADYNHPQDWVDNLWGAITGCPDANCGGGYDTKAYDDAIAAADALPLEQAIPKYQAIMKTLEDDAIYIPLYYSQGAFLIKPYVKGAGTNNFFDYYWNQIQILSH